MVCKKASLLSPKGLNGEERERVVSGPWGK